MKKLIITMAVALMVFGTSMSAWAAPITGNTSCTDNTILSKPGSTTSQTDSGYTTGIDAKAFFDRLKSSGSYTGTSTESTNAPLSRMLNTLNGLLDKCGIKTDLSSFFTDRPDRVTEKPSPAPGDNNTATPTPAPGSNDTATPAPAPGGNNTATPAPAPGGNDTATPTPAPGDNNTGTPSPSDNIDNLSYEQQVVVLVNEQRAANGLAPLTLNEKLSDVARAKSQDMHDNNYFSHTSPTYGSPFDMLKTFGISYRAAGENIAMGYATPQAVVNGWMNSAGHRANILNGSYTQIGVGYVADGHYWTQLFTD